MNSPNSWTPAEQELFLDAMVDFIIAKQQRAWVFGYFVGILTGVLATWNLIA